jgi:acetylornithine deacetylase/succinyl-diaminopimelate desuccinylase-like protein
MEIEQLGAEIERVVKEDNGNGAAIEVEANFVTHEAGYVLAAKGRVVSAIKSAFATGARGWKPSVFPSHSDANQFYIAGIMPIVLGCGRLQESHAPEEAVRFSEVIEAADLYYQTAVKMSLATER